MRKALQTLRKQKLYVNLSKCKFWLSEVVFLGHLMSSIGISIDLAKVDVVLRWERPRSAIEIQNFLGLAGYYR